MFVTAFSSMFLTHLFSSQFGCDTKMKYCTMRTGNAENPNLNAPYASIDRCTFDGVAASCDARRHHRHNGWIETREGDAALPVPFDHVRGLATIDYIMPLTRGGQPQPYFDEMLTARIVYTDKVLRALEYLIANNGFSPGTPPVNQPLTPCHSIALRAMLKQQAEATDRGVVDSEVTKKGTKRKTAPHTKGPCEHGVRPRSSCKVCSACPHGKRRCTCKECGGASICVHGRRRSKCKECGGSEICVHGRRRYWCKECGGGGICEHGRRRSGCKVCKKI